MQKSAIERQRQRPTGRGLHRNIDRLAPMITAWALLISSSATGCSRALEQQVIVYPEAAKAAAGSTGDCTLEMESSSETVRAGCSAIGDVFVGDSGQSIDDCELPDLLRIARTSLCGLGATHAHYRGISDTAVTCSQIRAVGFYCPSQGGVSR